MTENSTEIISEIQKVDFIDIKLLLNRHLVVNINTTHSKILALSHTICAWDEAFLWSSVINFHFLKFFLISLF